MTITITSTSKIIEINGVPARVWEGHTTDSGIKCHCFITRVAISKDESPEDQEQFKKELQETAAPSADVEVYPLRMII